MGMRVLIFSSLLLVALPWLGYRYIDEMKDFLLQGQQDAQLLAARAIATVLNGRTELFYLVDETADLSLHRSALYVYPLENPIEVDGYSGDWTELKGQAKKFGSESVIYDRADGLWQPVSFKLLLGQYRKYVYAHIRVDDPNIVYRNPKYRRLDHSDHIRLEFSRPHGDTGRFTLITEGEGQVSVYEMSSDWKFPLTGQPVYALSGVWREYSGGYDVELRLPAAWLGEQPQMMIQVANVDNDVERVTESIVATLKNSSISTLNPLITRSIELDRIVQGLGSAEESICVVDSYRHIRGLYGDGSDATLCSRKDMVSGELVDGALEGTSSVTRYKNPVGETIIVAAYPVYADDKVMGAVLVEKNSSHILSMQRESLLRIIVATLIVFLAAIFGLMLFAAWLSYRIRKLQKEASRAIDEKGRVIAGELSADHNSADEIGQLSRDISSLLSRLKSYTGFLESVPRTLRHEILNPVNTISMSLQKMEVDAENMQLLSSARKATRQLEMIVQGLTEAAHIEEALLHDEYERFDLAAMVNEYVENSRLKHGESRIRYRGPVSGVYLNGSDLRIAQLLDKLKDNALEFSSEDSEILFELTRQDNSIEISIINKGPSIAEDIKGLLFSGMVSSRPGEQNRPHLGIGLFIANRIAEQHHAGLKITNLDNGSGVSASLVLSISD
jgi:signal transduction histidine kinase